MQGREQTRRLVGRKLVRAMGDAGIDNRTLADRLGVDRRELRRWRNGEVEPIYYIRRIAYHLDKPTWWFYQPEDEGDLE